MASSSSSSSSSSSLTLACVGKPSAGKSSFLNAITDATAKVGNYPFTTIEPNHGVTYYPTECPCKRFGKTELCEPRYGNVVLCVCAVTVSSVGCKRRTMRQRDTLCPCQNHRCGGTGPWCPRGKGLGQPVPQRPLLCRCTDPRCRRQRHDQREGRGDDRVRPHQRH